MVLVAMEVTGVFEGGGVRGIALAGAAAAALDQGITFRTVVGTSAGAMVASLVAAGYEPDELRRGVCRVDWPSLLDPVPGYRLPLIGKHLALLRFRGFYRGDAIERTWAKLLARKGVRTFGDLEDFELRIVVTDLNHSTGVVLPEGLRRYGLDPMRFPIATAVRMSSAIPFMYRPVAIRDGRTGERVLFADGAMAANFPIGLAAPRRQVIGFVLEKDEVEHDHIKVMGPASLARSVILAGVHARYALPRPEDTAKRILRIPVRGDLDFNLSPRQARAVFDRGWSAAAEQLDGQPRNHGLSSDPVPGAGSR